MMKEERYHTLINHIDNHLDNSKIREVMTIDNKLKRRTKTNQDRPLGMVNP